MRINGLPLQASLSRSLFSGDVGLVTLVMIPWTSARLSPETSIRRPDLHSDGVSNVGSNGTRHQRLRLRAQDDQKTLWDFIGSWQLMEN